MTDNSRFVGNPEIGRPHIHEYCDVTGYPYSSAVSPSKSFAPRTISSARPRPTRWGRRSVPPPPGCTPTPTSGCPSRVFSRDAKRMSQARTNSLLAPRTDPRIFAMLTTRDLSALLIQTRLTLLDAIIRWRDSSVTFGEPACRTSDGQTRTLSSKRSKSSADLTPQKPH